MADGEEDKKIIIAGEEETKRIFLVGAGDESEEKKVGERNEKRNWNGDQLVPPPPPGFRFTPREDELVRYYLLPKLQGREHVPNDAIIEDNVYQCHPDQLTEKYRDRGDESWHFLSPRARKYRNGDRPSRSTDDSRGRWKASTGTKVVVISVDGGDGDGDGIGIKTTKSKAMMQQGAGDGKIRYSESTLSYYEGPIRNEVKSRWLMKELTIPEYEKKRGKNGGGGDPNMLNQYVMCKIYVTPRRRGDGDGDEEEDEAGPSWTQPEPEEDSGQGCEKLSEKQAGKRPAKDQSAGGAPKRAHRLNPDRLHLGPPPPLLGHGMHAPVMAPGYYGGGPGRPMGYYARPPVPRPPMMMYNNNGQAPVAYNGQVNMPRQQAAYNGGQVVPRQQAAYNGQVPVPRQQVPYNVPVPRQQVPYNGQVMRPPVLKLSPPYRPAGAPTSAGQNQTMMKRPPCPAGAPSSAGQNQTMTKRPPCPAGAPSSAGQNQTMMKRPPCPAGAPSSAGQNQTMMKRPPCPAGQAVKNPPSSAVPRPAQTQKQPETEEMRENRVLRQHMEEYSRIMQSSTPRPPVSAAHVAQQQQRRPVTAFTQQQQYQQQQQRPMMASTHQQQQYQQQQQQRPMMASTHQQQYQQQQRPMMASMHHHQQRPYFGGNANYHHHAGGMVPQYSLESFYASEAAQDYQHSRVIPAASAPAGPSTASAEGLVSSVVSGAGNEVSGANRDCSNGDEMEFVESASAGGTASAADGDGPKI